MTSRFVLVLLIAMATTMLFPNSASAQKQNTRLVFEIKNFPTVTIPDDQLKIRKVAASLSDEKISDNQTEIPAAEPIPVKTEPAPVVAKPKNSIPPKVADEEKIYMHEPEIRAYLCPKIGAKNCEIFIAVLKAENGTHECTRDNRGLNKDGSLDVGLAQINWNPKNNPPYTVEQLRDCKFNLDIALKKYEARGFQPWYAYTKGAYKKFLKPVPQISAATIQ